MRFRRLPLPARVFAILLPVLLLAGAGWGVYEYLSPPPPTIAIELPPAVITAAEARVVSRDAIAAEVQLEQVADGTPVTARLMAGDEEIQWFDTESNTGTVQGGEATLRLTRVADNAAVLDAALPYVVELTVATGDAPLVAQATLIVPDLLKDTFFAQPEPALEPTPAPTPAPTPVPTPAPSVAAGPPSVTMLVDATLLISPTLGTESVTTVRQGARFEPLLRTDDGQWLMIEQEGAVGWLPSDRAELASGELTAIPSVVPAAAAVAAGPYKAVVFNGGNIRYRPDVTTGTVLGQLHAGQSITLEAQSVDGQWFKVVAPEARGWVSVTLLTIDDAVIAKVPAVK